MRFVPAALAVVVALLSAGCGTVGLASENADKAKGRALFVESCGYCHTLSDAGTTGTIGPNLDDAFAGPRLEGFAESTIRQVVRGQIAYPTTEPVGVVETDGQEERAPGMPANLVTGDDADAVAAYVASVAGVAGLGGKTETTATTETMAAGADGKAVFAKAGCGSCHVLADAGASGTIGPNLDESQPPQALVVDRVTNGKGVMPPFGGQLSDAEIDAVATYVSTAAGK